MQHKGHLQTAVIKKILTDRVEEKMVPKTRDEKCLIMTGKDWENLHWARTSLKKRV